MALIHSHGVEEAYRKHKEFYKDKQLSRLLDQTIEEAAEVIQAICKIRRSCGSNEFDHLRDEVEDLILCIDFLSREIYPDEHALHIKGTDKALELIQKLTEAGLKG